MSLSLSCTVQKLEVSQPLSPTALPVSPKDVAAFAFVSEKNLDHDTLWQRFKFGAMVSGGAVFYWPVPSDLRNPYSPEIRIDDIPNLEFAEELSSQFNRLLGNDPQSFRLKEAADLSRLRSLAWEKGKRFVYLVVYNEFDEAKINVNMPPHVFAPLFKDSQWTGKGSLIMASRILMDAQTGEILLNQQRVGERYFWFPLLGNGWENSVFGGTEHMVEYMLYIAKVGAPDEATAVCLTAAHLIETDFRPQKVRN